MKNIFQSWKKKENKTMNTEQIKALLTQTMEKIDRGVYNDWLEWKEENVEQE